MPITTTSKTEAKVLYLFYYVYSKLTTVTQIGQNYGVTGMSQKERTKSALAM